MTTTGPCAQAPGVDRVSFRTALASLLMAASSACGARTGPVCESCGELPAELDASWGDGTARDDADDLRDDTSGSTFDVLFDTYRPDVAPPDAPSDAPPATVCPAALPKVGALCVPPLDCAYAGCDPATKDRASCVAGKWVLSAAACASPPDRCPLGIPTDGTACGLPDHTGCTWSTACAANVLGWCNGGRWVIKGFGGCSTGCPPTFPPEATTCSSPPASCTYVNECGVHQYASCTDGTWRGALPGCALDPACPPIEPPNGSACKPGTRPLCVWKNDCGGFDYGRCGWYLGEGQWTIFRPPCPATTCPSTPTNGTACSNPGLSCTYPGGGGCTIQCSCAGGAWTCIQDACTG